MSADDYLRIVIGMATNTIGTIEPHHDRILSMTRLAERWDIHPVVALKRAKKFLPIVRFNAKSYGVRLSDVLQYEMEASSTLPTEGAAK